MTASDWLTQILPRLNVVRGPDQRGEYVAWCPFHADGQGEPPHKPNLSVSERGWYCHVCQKGGGLKALARELGIDVRNQGNNHRESKITATYDYHDENGRMLFQVVRTHPKGFYQRRPDGKGGWTWNLDGTRRVLYRLPDLVARMDDLVWIVEGEKDADRLSEAGLLATANPGGVGKWRAEYSEFLGGREVVIIPDNDDPGERHARAIAGSLSGVTASVKIVRLPGLPPKGDVSDWLDGGHAVAELQVLADSTPEYDPEQSPITVAQGREVTVAPATVREAADDPHRLAQLYLSQHGRDTEGRLILHFWRDQWWRWTGTCYRLLEKHDLRAEITTAAKAEIDRWACEHHPTQEIKKITHHLATNILQALTGLVLVSAEVEQPAWLGSGDGLKKYLSMENGLVDLDACIAAKPLELIPHTPEFFSQVHLPYPFDPTARCPRWEEFLNEVLENDPERVAVIQEWFGYCLTADTTQQRFLMLEGDGANGKSVICEMLTSLLGPDNVAHVPLELFGQRFQLTQTLGRLANIAAEIGELDKAAEGTLKAFTSGDRMYFDRKGIPGIEAYPTARLVFSTNNRPRFSDRSSGLWRRMILLPFRVTIPQQRQNPRLAELLRPELPGIFRWALDGLHRLRERGHFTDAKVCTEAIEDYRVESNPARQFLMENVEEAPEDIVPCRKLYKRYRSWCDESGYRPLGDRAFGKEVFRLFPKTRRRRLGSRNEREWHYEGIAVSDVSRVSYVSIPGYSERR